MADQNINNMTVTWNSGGTTFNAVKFNVTDTASAAASLLLLLQVGGSDKFKVGKDGSITVAGNATISGNLLGAGKPPTQQLFTSGGTWTKPAGCRYAIFEAAGGGGAGGGVDGQGAGTAGGGGGGTSGAYGKTGFIDVSGTASAAVTIGAGGVGVAGAAGGAGGDTAITIGATTYTWAGGGGGPQVIATTSNAKQGFPGSGFAGTNVTAYAVLGGFGFSSAADNLATGGAGGRIPGMSGGGYPLLQSGSGAAAGQAASGNGGGGSGAQAVIVATNVAGGNGAAGFMRVWEFY